MQECSSTVIETIQRESDGVPALAYFYFDFKDLCKQGLRGCLSTLVAQVVQTNPVTWSEVRELFAHCRSGAVPPSTALLRSTLFALLCKSPDVYIILDGLEECREREREELLRLVTDIARDARMDTHVLLTS